MRTVWLSSRLDWRSIVENCVGVFGVEIAGGLIGKDDGGAINEGSSNSDALLLAAGELVGPVFEAALDAEHLGRCKEGLSSRRLVGAKVGDVVAISMLPIAERVGRG